MKEYKFDELKEDVRDTILEEIIQYDTEIDDKAFEIARRSLYDEFGEIIK